MEWHINNFAGPLRNDTCKFYGDENCLCHEAVDYPNLKAFGTIVLCSSLIYLCWILFSNVLQCDETFNCFWCSIYHFFKPQIRTQQNVEGHLEDQSDENNFQEEEQIVPDNLHNIQETQKFSAKKVFHFILLLAAGLGWIFIVPLLSYTFEHTQQIYLRWRMYYFVTSTISLIATSIYFLMNPKYWLNVLLLWGLMIPGCSQIFTNISNTATVISTKMHAQRLISTEYTFFVWLCFLFSLFTYIYARKNSNPIRDTFVTNKKFIMCLKMLAFMWSATLLREFINLFVDYENKTLLHLWNYLEWNEEKHLFFYNGFFIIASFLLSFCLQQNAYENVHWIPLTQGYITFHNVIYYFRISIIYKEFEWLISEIVEVFNGHIFVFAAIWFMLFLVEKKTMKTTNLIIIKF